MIKLDKWESQLVWLSKGWLDESFPDGFDLEEVLRKFWSHRCLMRPEHINEGYIASSMVELLEKVFDFSGRTLIRFLDNMRPQDKHTRKTIYTDSHGYIMHMIWVCLYNFLSTLQIKENKNDEKIILIELQPFEPELFIKGIDED